MATSTGAQARPSTAQPDARHRLTPMNFPVRSAAWPTSSTALRPGTGLGVGPWPAIRSSAPRFGAQDVAQGIDQMLVIVHALRVAADAGADGQRVGLRIPGGNQTIGERHLGPVPDDFLPRPAKTGDADADGFGGGAVIMRGGGSGQGQEGGGEDQAHG